MMMVCINWNCPLSEPQLLELSIIQPYHFGVHQIELTSPSHPNILLSKCLGDQRCLDNQGSTGHECLVVTYKDISPFIFPACL